MIPRIKVGKGVTGAVRYIMGEGRDPVTGAPRTQPKGEASRVAWFSGTGFGFAIETAEDAELARRIMEFDAQNQISRTRQCEKDCVHLSLGWKPGEQPTREQMETAALDALKAIGMGNAKAIFAAHTDEDYSHIHIVASKINPETGRAYDLKGNYLTLSKWALAYEQEHSGGVVCLRRIEANALRDAIDARDSAAVLEQLTKQRSTFTARDLERVLAKQIKSEEGRAAFTEKILTEPQLVKLSDIAGGPTSRYTTKTVLDAEAQVLRAAAGIADDDRHAVSQKISAGILNATQFDGITREQARAFRHATGAEGLALIDGHAGTGKSFTLAAIRQAYEAQGYKTVGLAPTNAVAQDMKRDGFAHAATIHSELFALANERTRWTTKTAVMVDEAAMIDTKLMAMLTTHAHDAGAKLILVGDDRQLSSIDRGGMYGVLKDRYGASELTQVRRQTKDDDRRASELMAEGNFADALARYETKGAIHWTRTQDEARATLVAQWAKDSAAAPEKTIFAFAYTNDAVSKINRDIRDIREARGELGPSVSLETKHGRADFAVGDRVQLTDTDKKQGLFNGNAGVLERLDGTRLTVRLDGREGREVSFDSADFLGFRHGYAGTVYKGQGRTLDQTLLYHDEHFRSAASYVAMTRHRDKAELFVATNTAKDLNTLARQMGRVDERRAASHFYHTDAVTAERLLTAKELAARFSQETHPQRDAPAREETPASAPKYIAAIQHLLDEGLITPAQAAKIDNASKALGDQHERDNDPGRRRERGGRTR